MNIKKKQRVNATSDYALFKKTYSHSREFKDKDKQSGDIRDLIDNLENKGISYEIYDNKTNNGCTIFYNDDGTVTAASYGRAFDIEDDQYFSKDEIVEFGNTVCDHLNEIFYDTYYVSDVYMETPNKLVLTVIQKSDESEFTATVDIDMRKIKQPSDLMNRYLGHVVYALRQDIEAYNDEINASSVITSAQNTGVHEIKTKIWNAALESTEVVNSGYSPDLLNDLVNYYSSFDTMSSEEIWDEIVARYNNEYLANDVLESLDGYGEDFDFADEEDEYDIYGSEDLEKNADSDDALWDVIDDEEFEFRGVQDVGYDNDGNIMVIFNHAISEDMIEPTAEELLIAFRQYGYPVHEWNTNGANVFILSRGGILSSTDTDFNEYEDDIQEISQEFTSENTSINSNKLPAIFKMVSFEPGTTNIDYGGGRFDNVADYLTQYDVINLVYDPYNRTPEHNKEVIKTLRRAGGADTATCSNVLNVIKEPEVRKNVLENISKIVKPGGKVYITVYEGSGKGDEGPTKAGYQLNRRTADYLDEIREVFPDANRKGKLIVATNSRTVNSSTNIKASSTEGYVYTYCDECGKKNRVKVTFNNFNEPFNDTEYKCKYCGAYNLLTDPHSYDENGYVVEASQSSSSVEARSYGGAYDVDPEQYFTREDLVEFADDVISCIANSQDILFDVSELYIEGNNITLGLTNTNNGGGFEHTVTFTVDMRKIRKPWDLQTKYSQKIASMFIDEYNKAIEEDDLFF